MVGVYKSGGGRILFMGLRVVRVIVIKSSGLLLATFV